MKATKKDKKLKKAFQALYEVYRSMPDTKGCLEHINKPESEGGCAGWCCLLQNPHVLYVEFLNTWRHVLRNWAWEDVTTLIEKALRNYLSQKITKGCIFFDNEKKLCKQHTTRPFNCFLPDTLIYTSHGAKPIGQVIAGDSVLTDDGTYQMVESTITRIHDGQIYRIAPQGSTVYCWSTGDHRWLTARQKDKRKKPIAEYRFADTLVSKAGKEIGDYLVFPRLGKHSNTSQFLCVADFISGSLENGRVLPFTSGVPEGKSQQSIPFEFEINSEFLFMFGIYLAEGYSSSQSTCFCMNINECEHLERIAAWMDKNDIRWHWSKTNNPTNKVLRVDSCLFARLMKTLGGYLAENKAINGKFFNMLSADQLYSVFEAYAIGDGRKSTDCVEFSTSSKSILLSAQMCQILLINDLYPRFREVFCAKDGRKSYEVVVNKSSFSDWHAKPGQGGKVMYDELKAYVPLAEVEKKHYQGPVVDIQVAKNSCFVTVSGIAHNCRVYGITPDEEMKPRIERLRILYKNRVDAQIKDQCALVKTVDDSKVTTKMTAEWWKRLMEIETTIGIKKKQIHDKSGGSYMTYHDHILLHCFPDVILKQLQILRVHGTIEEREIAIKGIMDGFRKKVQSLTTEDEDEEVENTNEQETAQTPTSETKDCAESSCSSSTQSTTAVTAATAATDGVTAVTEAATSATPAVQSDPESNKPQFDSSAPQG